jgi:SAM-dependent methyltransferase
MRENPQVLRSLPLDSLLAPGRTLRPARGQVMSAVAAEEDAAAYDRHAALYDRLIGNRLYNRLVWAATPGDYEAFAAEAVAAGDGLFLDAGCGTLVFTAAAYRRAARPLVLVDLSLGMLQRAAGRLGDTSATLLQADLLDLPFSANGFATVACFGTLHVFDDPWAALAALRDQLAPGGRFFASMLVSDRAIGRAYLAAVHRRGEVGPPRRAAELTAAARTVFGTSADVRCTGSMAWLRAVADAPRLAG